MNNPTFLTLSYKQGFIFITTHATFERVEYCPKDGLGAFPCKSVHAAKIRISKFCKEM